jgi:hypothetical protein
MLGDRFLIDFDAFGELAMSPRFSCVRSGHLNTTDGITLYIHATRDNKVMLKSNNKKVYLLLKVGLRPFGKPPNVHYIYNLMFYFGAPERTRFRF